MIIGNWDITIVDSNTFELIPGDHTTRQTITTYDFKYIPQRYHLVRTIQYIKFISDDDKSVFLESFAKDLKKNFIDRRSAKDIENDFLQFL